jgi:citrate lyase subunit beta/citryl-CoA lyase
MKLFRTLLFAPGARLELLTKSQSGSSDALIFDLEDSVPHNAKDEARRNVSQVLQEGLRKPMFLRINNPRAGDYQADLAVLATQASQVNVMGVILPKAELTSDIEQVGHALTDIESRYGMPLGSLKILPLVETCMGLRNTFDLASASSRVCGMSLASAEQGDFMVDLGGRWSPQSLALAYPRSKMVVDARAAGLQWLVDGVFMNLQDLVALRTECDLARELGFVGKMAIHPSQVQVMQEVFSPSESDIQYARGLLAAFAEAEARGLGAVRYQGMMVDYANVRLAQRTLSLVETP